MQHALGLTWFLLATYGNQWRWASEAEEPGLWQTFGTEHVRAISVYSRRTARTQLAAS